MVWTAAVEKAFQQLKNAFTSASILNHPDPKRPFTVEMDASDTAVGTVLSLHFWEAQKLLHNLMVKLNMPTRRLGGTSAPNCTKKQNEWVLYIPWVEYEQNSLKHFATNLTPSHCILGFQPPLFPWNFTEAEDNSGQLVPPRVRHYESAPISTLNEQQIRESTLQIGVTVRHHSTSRGIVYGLPTRTYSKRNPGL